MYGVMIALRSDYFCPVWDALQVWDEHLFEIARSVHSHDDPQEVARLLEDSILTAGGFADFQGVSKFRGQTALHLAARAGRQLCCECLVQQWRACLDLRDENGATPLILAAMKGREGIVAYLLQVGSDPNVRARHRDHKDHDTALGWARRLGHAKVVDAMVDYHDEVMTRRRAAATMRIEATTPTQPPTPPAQPSPVVLTDRPVTPSVGQGGIAVTESEAFVTRVEF